MTCDRCKRQVTWRVKRRGQGMVCRTCNDKAWLERRHADADVQVFPSPNQVKKGDMT